MGEPDADIDQLLEEQVGVMLFDTFCEDVCAAAPLESGDAHA